MATQSEESARIDRWKAVKIIPDVVDQVAPVFRTLRVAYAGTEVSDGLPMGRAQTSTKPHVELEGAIKDDQNLYTLVMVDPDPPSPDMPIYRHWLHWAVMDIPGTTGPSQELWETGTEIVPYAGPTPPAGVHRYVILLYEQNGSLTPRKIQERKQFNITKFVEEYELGFPVAGLYYTVKQGD